MADNATEDITPQNLRDMLHSYHIFGEIGMINNTTAMTNLPAGWNAVPLDQAGPAQGVTVDAINHLLGVDVDGQYRVEYMMSYSGTTAQKFRFCILKNDAEVGRTERQDTTTANQEIRNVSGSGTLNLTSTDEIKLGVRSSGNDFTLRFGGLRIERLE